MYDLLVKRISSLVIVPGSSLDLFFICLYINLSAFLTLKKTPLSSQDAIVNNTMHLRKISFWFETNTNKIIKCNTEGLKLNSEVFKSKTGILKISNAGLKKIPLH